MGWSYPYLQKIKAKLRLNSNLGKNFSLIQNIWQKFENIRLIFTFIYMQIFPLAMIQTAKIQIFKFNLWLLANI
jgi:hypothetical protein